jgi:hypothetical protein
MRVGIHRVAHLAALEHIALSSLQAICGNDPAARGGAELLAKTQ